MACACPTGTTGARVAQGGHAVPSGPVGEAEPPPRPPGREAASPPVETAMSYEGVGVDALLANTGGLAAGTPAASGGSASPTGHNEGRVCAMCSSPYGIRTISAQRMSALMSVHSCGKT
jgi:hypothetical protein